MRCLIKNSALLVGLVGITLLGCLRTPVEAGFAPSNILVSRGDSVDEFTPDGDFVRTLITRSGPVGSLTFGPDGLLYVATLDGIIRYDGDTGEELGVMTPLAGRFRFGPDGLVYVADFSGSQVHQIDPTTGSTLQSFATLLASPAGLTFRANGNVLVSHAFDGSAGSITEIDLATGQSTLFSTGYGQPWGLATGPDGRHYAANGKFGVEPRNSVQVVDDAGGPPSLFASDLSDGPNDLAFNGTDLFVVTYYNSAIYRIDGATGATIWSSSPYLGQPGAVAIAVRPIPAPPALASAMLGLGTMVPWAARRRRRRERRSLHPVERLEDRRLLTGWLSQMGGPGANMMMLGLAADDAGNTYASGLFNGTVDFDPGPGETWLTSQDGDAFVAKFDASGALVWVTRPIEGPDGQQPTLGVALDGTGGVYLAGFGSGTSQTASGPGALTTGNWLARLDAATGQVQWAQAVEAAAYNVAADAEGNLYTTGPFSNTVSFGAISLTSRGGDDTYLAKYDNAGSLQWVRQIGGAYDEIGWGVAVDEFGTAYVGGTATGGIVPTVPVTFDTTGGPGLVKYPARSKDGFMAKYAPDGTVMWAQIHGGYGTDELFALTADRQSDGQVFLYAAGSIDDEARFGTLAVGAGDRGGYVARIDSATGEPLWVRTTRRMDYLIRDIATDGAGNVAIAGEYHGVPSDFGPAQTVDFDPGPSAATLPFPSGYDAAVWRYDASGNFLEVRSVGDSQNEMVHLEVNTAGDVWTALDVGANETIDTGELAPRTLTRVGSADGYVTKLGRAGAAIRGKAYSDFNSDGLNDQDKKGVGGVTVFLDTDADGVLDPGETSAVTDAEGAYWFRYLVPGSYRVVAQAPTGWTNATSPQTVTVVGGEQQAADFAMRATNQTATYNGKSGNIRKGQWPNFVSEFTVNVSQNFTIWDLDVKFNITFPDTRELHVELVAPDGTKQSIARNPGSLSNTATANLSNITLDDAATRPIGVSPAPFSGTYRPTETLDIFHGKNASGTWKLRITNYEPIAGKVNSWSLVFTRLASGNSPNALGTSGFREENGLAGATDTGMARPAGLERFTGVTFPDPQAFGSMGSDRIAFAPAWNRGETVLFDLLRGRRDRTQRP